jgi:type I restriction enzyme S subunit
MSQPWPMVALGEVLAHRKDFIQIDDLQRYKRCRVQLHAQGILLRDTVDGMEIKTKKQQVCRAGEFLVAEIDAKLGGFGIVPPELEGAVVSSHYFLYVLNEQKLDRRFLGYFIRTPAFKDQVTAQGSTNYAAIRPQDVLRYRMPLPPLAEQRRIVAKIDALAAKIEEAKRLQGEVREGLNQLCRAIIHSDAHGANQPTPMQQLVRHREPDVEVRADQTYHFAGVYCFGEGVFRGQRKSGMEFKYNRLTRLKAGNFVYPKLMAWEGALGVVPTECDGLVVSTEFPVFEINTDKVLPEVLEVYFRTPSVWPELSGVSTGTNVRRRRLNPADFLRYKFPLPTMARQHRLQEVTHKAEEIRSHQRPAVKELHALVPAILDRSFRGEL